MAVTVSYHLRAGPNTASVSFGITERLSYMLKASNPCPVSSELTVCVSVPVKASHHLRDGSNTVSVSFEITGH